MVKFNSRLPVWLLLAVIGACLFNIYYDLGYLGSGSSERGVGAIITVVSMTILAAVFANGIRNKLSRPVVEVDDDGISYGTVFQLSRKHAALAEVEEVIPSDEGKVVLRMKSGRNRKISLFEVARADRATARKAILGAVARE